MSGVVWQGKVEKLRIRVVNNRVRVMELKVD